MWRAGREGALGAVQHFSAQDHFAAAMAKAGTATVFAWKGDVLPGYWYYTEQMMTVPCADGCDLLMVDGGDATPLIYNARSAEAHDLNHARMVRRRILRARLTREGDGRQGRTAFLGQ